MGGRILVRSMLGRGSAFVLQVPLSIAPCRPQDDVTEPSGDVAGPGARGTSILLAEDHPTNQKVVAMILEPAGVELTIVDNGRAAVEAARARTFDLILMDIQMPVMDGLTATGLIRKDEQAGARRRTPVVCLTANVDEAQVQACLAAGGDRHLAKPFRAETLLQTVFDLLPSEDTEAA
jgi:CheY-like chemotaxis protein